MVLISLTLLPLAYLLLTPVTQRFSGRCRAWQAPATQVALWACVALGVLWSLQLLDEGQGVLALIPAAVGVALLLQGTSGGFKSLVNGRLGQGALLALSLLALQLFSGYLALALAGTCLLTAALFDAILERIAAQPELPKAFEEHPVLPQSHELTGTVLGGRAQEFQPETQPPEVAERSDWVRPRKLNR